jgi:hypothetical protein
MSDTRSDPQPPWSAGRRRASTSSACAGAEVRVTHAAQTSTPRPRRRLPGREHGATTTRSRNAPTERHRASARSLTGKYAPGSAPARTTARRRHSKRRCSHRARHSSFGATARRKGTRSGNRVAVSVPLAQRSRAATRGPSSLRSSVGRVSGHSRRRAVLPRPGVCCSTPSGRRGRCSTDGWTRPQTSRARSAAGSPIASSGRREPLRADEPADDAAPSAPGLLTLLRHRAPLRSDSPPRRRPALALASTVRAPRHTAARPANLGRECFAKIDRASGRSHPSTRSRPRLAVVSAARQPGPRSATVREVRRFRRHGPVSRASRRSTPWRSSARVLRHVP